MENDNNLKVMQIAAYWIRKKIWESGPGAVKLRRKMHSDNKVSSENDIACMLVLTTWRLNIYKVHKAETLKIFKDQIKEKTEIKCLSVSWK